MEVFLLLVKMKKLFQKKKLNNKQLKLNNQNNKLNKLIKLNSLKLNSLNLIEENSLIYFIQMSNLFNKMNQLNFYEILILKIHFFRIIYKFIF